MGNPLKISPGVSGGEIFVKRVPLFAFGLPESWCSYGESFSEVCHSMGRWEIDGQACTCLQAGQ